MGKNIIAIIHARGNSKRIPLKNIQILNNLPLIAYPIKLAKSIKIIKRIIVSTDHNEIAKIALKYGAEVPFVRPRHLSYDVPSELVTEHALKYLIKEDNCTPDIVVTLTPCHPFTSTYQLNKGIKMLIDNEDWDSVVTVKKVKEHPQWMIDLKEDNSCETILGNNLDGDFNVSQRLKKYYYLHGAFFINRVSSFLTAPSLYGEKWGAIVVNSKNSIDIDEPEDLLLAQSMISQ